MPRATRRSFVLFVGVLSVCALPWRGAGVASAQGTDAGASGRVSDGASRGASALAADVAAHAAHPADEAATRAHWTEAARAGDDRTAAEAHYHLADLDDEAFRFRDALGHYEASAARLPSGRYTPRAQNRAAELRSHAEGDFAPLVMLETVRRSPERANDPRVIDGLVAAAADFPPGKVRVEARMLAAEAYAGRLRRKDDALPLLREVIDDPNAEVLTAREAASELLAADLAKEDYAEALALARQHPKLLEKAAERNVVRLRRRRPLRIVAALDLGLLTTLALLVLRKPGRRRSLLAAARMTPMAIVFAVVAAGGGGFLASRYEQTNPYPFAAMLPVMSIVIVLARLWSAGGSSAAAPRALRAGVAFASVFAAAFLLLDRMDPAYLAGFGL